MLQKWKRFAVAVGTLSLFGLVGWLSAEHVWGTYPGVKYRMSKVERGDITAYVSATGTLNPVIMVQVGTQVSGTIEKLFADFNSTVVPGQQLAQLDQASFRAKVVQAEANLDTARAEVKNALANVHNMRASIETARADAVSRVAQLAKAQVTIVDTKRILDRQRALFERSLLPRSEVETAQTAYDTAVTQYNAAQADRESAEAKLPAARAQLGAAEAQVEKPRPRCTRRRRRSSRPRSTSIVRSSARRLPVRSFHAVSMSVRQWPPVCKPPYSLPLPKI